MDNQRYRIVFLPMFKGASSIEDTQEKTIVCTSDQKGKALLIVNALNRVWNMIQEEEAACELGG